MKIRLANINDAEALFELNKNFGNTTTIDRLKKSLESNNAEIVCVAYDGGALAGFCSGLIVQSMCHATCRGHIEALYVRDEHRRQGLAHRLIGFLEQAYAARGIKHFHIDAETDNPAALGLYKKLGYAAAGEILMDKTIV